MAANKDSIKTAIRRDITTKTGIASVTRANVGARMDDTVEFADLRAAEALAEANATTETKITQALTPVDSRVSNLETKALRDKGYFPTVADLLAAFPNGSAWVNGDKATVGATKSIWIRNPSGTWVDTDDDGGAASFDANPVANSNNGITSGAVFTLGTKKVDIDPATGRMVESQAIVKAALTVLQSELSAVPNFKAGVAQVLGTAPPTEGSTAPFVVMIDLATLGTNGGGSTALGYTIAPKDPNKTSIVASNDSISYIVTATGGKAPYNLTQSITAKPDANSPGFVGQDSKPAANQFDVYAAGINTRADQGNSGKVANGNYTLTMILSDADGVQVVINKTFSVSGW